MTYDQRFIFIRDMSIRCNVRQTFNMMHCYMFDTGIDYNVSKPDRVYAWANLSNVIQRITWSSDGGFRNFNNYSEQQKTLIIGELLK